MKYYSYAYYDPDPEKRMVKTLSEQEILDEYWDYWKECMEKKFKKEFNRDEANKLGCITDWCVVHWAWESLHGKTSS